MNSFSYDITIAYSNEKDMTRIAIPLREELERKGVNVRLFDVNTGSCLGAVCDSHFFVPILTDHYLTRSGTTDDLNDSTTHTLRERRMSFTFYPVIPVVEDTEDLRRRTEWPAYYKNSFSRLNFFSRPHEIRRFLLNPSPAMNCRAILNCPHGTGNVM